MNFIGPPRTRTWKIETLIVAFIVVGDATRFREERFVIILRLFMLLKYPEKAPALLFSQGSPKDRSCLQQCLDGVRPLRSSALGHHIQPEPCLVFVNQGAE